MLTVTNAFKNEIKKQSVYSDGKFDLKYDSTTIPFDHDDIISMEIYGSALQNDTVLGNLAQHSLTISVHGDITKDINLAKLNLIEPYIGIYVGSAYEYVKQQTFLITDIIYSDTNNQTKIIATDYLYKLNKEFVDTNTYPMTLKAYLESVLTSCGLSLHNTTFLNSDFVVSSKPFNDYTVCKEIISRVSELALCYGIINKVNDKVELRSAFINDVVTTTHAGLSVYTHNQLGAYTHEMLKYITNTNLDLINKDAYISLKMSDHNFGANGVNTLVLKISQVDGENNTVENATNVAIDGAIEVVIEDNPLINTEALRLSVIDAMFATIDGKKFQPYTLEYRGFPYIEIGDMLNVVKMDNSEINLPIYETNIKYNGGLFGKLSAKALNKTQTSYKYISKNTQRVRNAEIQVDKVAGEVTILAGDYYDGKLEGAKYVFDGTNATFTNGGLIIKNAANEVVFTADIDGNLDIVGKITATSGLIGRLSILNDDIYYESDLFANQYDETDVTRLRQILAGATPTDYENYIYDVNASGLPLTATDLVQLRQIVAGTLANPNRMVRSRITIGKVDGQIVVTSVDTNGNVGGSFILQAGKITGKQSNIEYIQAKQLTFGNNGVSSGVVTSNAINYAEDGTFTPVFFSTDATFTYAKQSGIYSKVGRIVTASIYIQVTEKSGTLTNNVFISALPFLSKSADDYGFSAAIGVHQFAVDPSMFMSANSEGINIYQNGTVTPLKASQVNNGFYLLTITYFTD